LEKKNPNGVESEQRRGLGLAGKNKAAKSPNNFPGPLLYPFFAGGASLVLSTGSCPIGQKNKNRTCGGSQPSEKDIKPLFLAAWWPKKKEGILEVTAGLFLTV